jgi:ribosomal protein S15P/S13E
MEEEKKKKKMLTEKEFEKRVVELAESGLTSEKIGELLRKEGIHPSEYPKKISKILKENGKYVNPDLKNIEEKVEKIKNHFEKNKQDKKAARDRDRIYSKLRKLRNYFSKRKQ